MPEPVALKYRAFLSYAHADTRWATWLHRQVEGFRIDKDLVGRTTGIGPVPRTLSPVFRDREDFAGGHTLADATVAELDQSAALIVLCSTVAAGRPAVQEEVRLFRSRHPGRPVIPVVVEGTYPDNFPPALLLEWRPDGTVTDRRSTVLGADLRETADGRSLGIAKVVAGLTGLDTDVIFRRAERARRRRLQRLVAVATAALVVVLVLGGWAETQRRRFANYLEMATKFNAFEVVDVTGGWDTPRQLAQDTLEAMRHVVSDRWGFRQVRILWFDDKPDQSWQAKKDFLDGLRGVGVHIRVEQEIGVAKAAIADNFDIVIANYGNPKDRFAYQLLSAIDMGGLATPLVIYGADPDPRFAREARCHGAVARATTIDALFTAVIRGLAADGRKELSSAERMRCIDQRIKPYDTPAWQQWLQETKAGNTPAMPKPIRD